MVSSDGRAKQTLRAFERQAYCLGIRAIACVALDIHRGGRWKKRDMVVDQWYGEMRRGEGVWMLFRRAGIPVKRTDL